MYGGHACNTIILRRYKFRRYSGNRSARTHARIAHFGNPPRHGKTTVSFTEKGRGRAGEGSLSSQGFAGVRAATGMSLFFPLLPILYSYRTRDAALTTFFRVRSESHTHVYIYTRKYILVYAVRVSTMRICKRQTQYRQPTGRSFESNIFDDKNRRMHRTPRRAEPNTSRIPSD